MQDLDPNPFRHLERYPIDQEKVDRLVQSIQHTGYWGNIMGRLADRKVQIAYGHHRLEALKKLLKPTEWVQVIIEDLDDDKMLQVMADENDDVYSPSPAIINETVRATVEHLRKTGRLSRSAGRPEEREREVIAKFLNWGKNRVAEALADIHAIDGGAVVKEVEDLPSQRHATEFRHAVKKHKVSPEIQKKVIEGVKEKNLRSREVKAEVFQHLGKVEDESFNQLLNETIEAIRTTAKLIQQVLNGGQERLLSSRDCFSAEYLKDLRLSTSKLLKIVRDPRPKRLLQSHRGKS